MNKQDDDTHLFGKSGTKTYRNMGSTTSNNLSSSKVFDFLSLRNMFAFLSIALLSDSFIELEQ